jgi:glutathione peroxidase-family protein
MTTFYDLKAEQPGNKVLDFADLKGKVVLIVNTASQWCVLIGRGSNTLLTEFQWVHTSVQGWVKIISLLGP